MVRQQAVRQGMMTVMFLGLATMGGRAMGQAQPTTFRGTVTSIGINGSSFIVTDSGGINTVIKTNGDTRYQLDRQDSVWAEVLKVGQTVRGNLNIDGSAALISARSPRLSIEDQIGKALGSTDEEWEVLRPKVVAVLERQAAWEDLTKKVPIGELEEPPVTNGEVRASLAELRKQRDEAAAALAQARRELVELLTLKQEWTLVQLGLLG